jgi:8-oxo-dGTP pyrophosphatase MutT (NUDIX family)
MEESYTNRKQYYVKFNKNTTICINCDKIGHTFKYCKNPITSYGIICYNESKVTEGTESKVTEGTESKVTEGTESKVTEGTESTEVTEGTESKVTEGTEKEIKETEKESINLSFLLIQRKDTIGYIDFLRGKYNTIQYMKILLQEMTKEEHQKLINFTFDELWDKLWISKTSRTYKNEYLLSKIKFEKLDLKFLIENTPTKYINSEFDIPKGRRSNMETIKDCAIREFMEETGYKKNEFTINESLEPIEEIFLGSNSIWYKHVYFFAKINTNRQTIIGDHPLQIREIKKVSWYNFKESINIFRKYDKTKRMIIYKAKQEIARSACTIRTIRYESR